MARQSISNELETTLLYWSNEIHSLFDTLEDLDNYQQRIDLEDLMNQTIEQLQEDYQNEFEFIDEEIAELHRAIDIELEKMHDEIQSRYEVIIPLEQTTKPMLPFELKNINNYSDLSNSLQFVFRAVGDKGDKILNLLSMNHDFERYAQLELRTDELSQMELKQLPEEINDTLNEEYRLLEIYFEEIEERLIGTTELWESEIVADKFMDVVHKKAEEIIYEP